MQAESAALWIRGDVQDGTFNHGSFFWSDANSGARSHAEIPVCVSRRVHKTTKTIQGSHACCLLFWMVFLAAASGRAQVNVPAPASAQKILSKDPDYLKLLNAPQSGDFLRTYSEGYRQKSTEIEARLADVSDAALRKQTRADEWASVPKKDQDAFGYEADVAFREAKIAFSRRHRDGWIDVGSVAYNEIEKSLLVKSSSTTPIDAYFRVPMDGATVNQIYEKFHQLAAPEIDRQAHDYVTKSGANSQCSRNADWCFKIKQDEIERTLRSERMVVVARGDLEQEKIDRYLLVDRDTETVLLEIDPHTLLVSSLAWRFSIGPVPIRPVEPEPAQSTTPAGQGTSARISVPANVTAASIISQTKPEYPPEARAKQLHGDVVLRAIIDKEGKISEVHVLSGDDVLAKAAVEAVRQWRYKPMLSDGVPTEVETTITVSFSLLE
jgi:TonB family protein